MATIQVIRRHMSSDKAEAEVAHCYGHGEIGDACAVTIASWWQSPGTTGRVLAAFASGMPVDHTELLDDIHRTYPEALTSKDRMGLDMLATWILAKVRDVGGNLAGRDGDCGHVSN